MHLSELPKDSRQPLEILAYRSPPEKGEFPSGALSNIQQKFYESRQKVSILDLGPCNQSLVDRFSEHGLQIVFEDLKCDLGSLSTPAAEGQEHRAIGSFLTKQPPGKTFDLITAWDLLNYLNPERLRELFEHLAAHTRPDTMVFALLSTLTRMPEEPGEFSLGENAQVIYELHRSTARPCPRYSPRDIERLAPQFSIDRLVLLKNGYYELLFKAR